jgi:hypothetical protein
MSVISPLNEKILASKNVLSSRELISFLIGFSLLDILIFLDFRYSVLET